ncbi:MAG TPA: Ni/Fe-hydrogenase cytochrome b subunit [Longimicrobiales bacterium]|jgi:Ni/Fe-hydrogenase subunit HybB-like protein/Fe-S-cluster-containing dehydrogenase component
MGLPERGPEGGARGVTRRFALGSLAAAAATAALPCRLRGDRTERPDAKAILYDSSLCIGCRECVAGCAEANGWDSVTAFSIDPALTDSCLTVVRRYENEGESCFLKLQCMHCLEPACASACMLGALHVDDDGAVVWDPELCVGCRYCQIACPFGVPRFDWDMPVPALHKCDMCRSRREEGLQPACVESCRRGALTFGTRDELLAEAHHRIAARPDRYNPKVYGETDGGGTSVLYLTRRGVSFAQLGLPELGDESPATLPESIQHMLYRWFAAPTALFGLLATVVHRNSRSLHAEEAEAHVSEKPEPVGGPLLTRPVLVLAALAIVGVVTVLWRFVAGLGATTNLNDGYPMGLWIAFDVVTGTALACGGYAMALLVYVANRGRYHPLVRPALLTSAFGYTLAGLSVMVDIGRPWNAWRIPTNAWHWNLSSILLEVALCIMLYTAVLWIEVSPAVVDRLRDSRARWLREGAAAVSPRLERALPWFIALGILLPTMHQSSLGSMMLVAGVKLHPLWHTPLLPLLFLVSCVGMGYAAVSLESYLSARAFNRPVETPMLRALAVPAAIVLLAYAVIRIADVVARGRLGLVTRMDGYSALFLVEMVLFVGSALGLLLVRRRAGAGLLTSLAAVAALGGALYRFSTFLIAYRPVGSWSYFPALPEILVTVGFVAMELLGYALLVKTLPILRGATVPKAPEPALKPAIEPAIEPAMEPAMEPAVEPVVEPVWEPEAVESWEADGEDDEAPSWPGGQTSAKVTLGLALVIALAACQSSQPAARHQTAGTPSDSLMTGDMSCLTRRAEDCLDEPVPADEPHGGVCAVCHDLWDVGRRSGGPVDVGGGTIRSCASSECHAEPETLTVFHRSVDAAVLSDCGHCHVPHDFRVPDAGSECTACHDRGGRPASWIEGPETGALAGSLGFLHTDHDGMVCADCHRSPEEHGTLERMAVEDCRGCHHAPARADDCLDCHVREDVLAVSRTVTRTLDIQVGSLDLPARALAFDHRVHEAVECRACHTGAVTLGGAEGADCSRCHGAHDVAGADCLACHAPPVDGAHDERAHLGCGGSGCHEPVPAGLLPVPLTRPTCLLCHEDQTEHWPGVECTACHALPTPPRTGR